MEQGRGEREGTGNRKQETGNRYRLRAVESSKLEQFLFPVPCFLFPVPYQRIGSPSAWGSKTRAAGRSRLPPVPRETVAAGVGVPLEASWSAEYL